MAKTIPFHNIAHARAFVERFGFGERNVPVDQFDMFIIDRGLAQDPGTSDTSDVAYKGFIQQRGAARRLLNTAGTWINGSSFQLVVDKERGKPYSVVKWAVDANEYAKNITAQVETFVGSRMANLKALRNKAEALVESDNENDDIHDSLLLLSSMAGHGVSLQAKIAGYLKQYDTAYAAVVSNIERAIQLRLEEASQEQ